MNAELKRRRRRGTVTVDGGMPTVDIQNVVQRRVVTRDVMDAIPTGNRSWAALAMLVPGAKVGSQRGRHVVGAGERHDSRQPRRRNR